MGNQQQAGDGQKPTKVPKFSKVQVEYVTKLWHTARQLGPLEPGRSILIQVLTQAPEIETIFHFAKVSEDLPMKVQRKISKPVNFTQFTLNPDRKDSDEATRRGSLANDEPTDFRNHSRRFTNVMDSVVNNLTSLSEEIHDLLFQLGKNHVDHGESGFSPEHWDVFADAMISKVLECSTETDPAGQRTQRETWTLVVYYVVNRMKDGYRNGMRLRREQSMGNLGSTYSIK